MHIVYISNENPYNMNNGGIGTYCKYVVKMMAGNGNRISFITISDCEHEKCVNQFSDDYCEINIYQIKYKRSWDNFPADLIEIFYQKTKEIHNNNPIDIIECQDWLGIGYKITQNLDIPFITRLHTPLFLVEKLANNQKIYRFSNEIKKYEEIQMKNSTALSAPCSELADIIYSKIKRKVKIIPNPIDVKEFNPEIIFSRPKLVKHKKYLLYLGRLEYRKGVLVLAEAIEQILNKYSDYVIVMCGKDTVYKKRSVKSLIKEKCAQFEDSVYFIENVEGNEKKAYIQNAELIIQPSLWENFSYVTLEAMACSQGVLATRCGGFIEIIDDNKSGFLAEPYSVESLINKIDTALKSNLHIIGKQARKKVVQNYDIHILRDCFEEYYKSIIINFHKKL